MCVCVGGGGGGVQVGGRDGSMWWREIVKIRDGVGSAMGTWFSNNLCLKVENGSGTLFWVDR